MNHGKKLILTRCPHCGIAVPYLPKIWEVITTDCNSNNKRYWGCYECTACGGLCLAVSPESHLFDIVTIWPSQKEVPEEMPARAKDFLSQAMASMHAPSGAVMLTASAVDAMLKDLGYKDGSLYKRIDDAAKVHLITQEMAAWAHEIRLEANDQRHADEDAPLPSAADAEKSIEFANALAQFLYVLPARVARGRKA